MSSLRCCRRFKTLTNEMSAVIVLFVRFGARIQCATSKLADAVDTECHRERCSIIIGKNGPFFKSVPFPLKVGCGMYMEFKGRNEMKGRKERQDSLGMNGVEKGVEQRCECDVHFGRC